jgi:phage-related protein
LISAAVNNVRNIITTVFNTLSSIISNVWNAVKNITSSAWENIKNAAVNGAHNIGNAVRSLPSEIGRILGNLGSSALKWGKDMIDGFVNGIKSKYNDVKNAVTGIGDKVKSLMHFTEPDEGPLKDFNSWAPDMIRNYAKGITDNSYLVQKAIEGVTSDVASLAGLNNQQLDADSLYRAVNKGASDATVTAVIGDRELARKLREMGVVFE